MDKALECARILPLGLVDTLIVERTLACGQNTSRHSASRKAVLTVTAIVGRLPALDSTAAL